MNRRGTRSEIAFHPAEVERALVTGGRLVAALVDRERARIAEIERGVLFKDEIDETLKRKGVLS